MYKLKRKTLPIFVICIFLFFTFLSGCIFPTEHMVEMKDGVHLATDVYVPRRLINPHGSILIRTPYDKNLISIIGSLMIKILSQLLEEYGLEKDGQLLFRILEDDSVQKA